MDQSTLIPAIAGGAMCGVACVGLMATHGRIAGVSGLFGSGTDGAPIEDRTSRWAFLGGLVAAGLTLGWLAPTTLQTETPASTAGVLVAGLLVGAGSYLANGCTSGHGVAGLGRLSPRSLVAVTLFCAAGAASLLLGGGLLEVAP